MVYNSESIAQELQTLPVDLYDTYTRTLKRIRNTGLHSKAIRALRWVALSRRPLSVQELTEACSLTEDLTKVPQLVEGRGLNGNEMNRLLSDLLYFDPPLSEDSVPAHCLVTLSHASVQDYLVGNNLAHQFDTVKEPLLAQLHNGKVRTADVFIAKLCMAFVFSYNKLDVRRVDHPLISYAWYHWDEHLDSARPTDQNPQYFRDQAAKVLAKLHVDFSQHLQWLPEPQDQAQQTLVESLDVPYFYTDFEDFKHFSQSTSILTQVKDGHERLSNDQWERVPKVLTNPYVPTLLGTLASTRLLEVLPGLSRNSSIVCRMRTVLIDGAPMFDAITYEGHGRFLYGKHFMIFVNGRQLGVDREVRRILGNLRLRSEIESGYLWISSISIAQGDPMDSSQRAAFLAFIFSRARKVLLYFGEARQGDSEAVETFISIAAQVASSDNKAKTKLRMALLHPEKGCAQLFVREYWNNVTVVQEIVLARDINLLFGNALLSLQHMEACLPLFDEKNLEGNLPKFRLHCSWMKGFLLILRTRRRYHERGGCDLLDVMKQFEIHSYKSPSEDIHLLLTLSRIGPNIILGHGEDLATTYSRITLAIMKHDKDLRCLSYCSVREFVPLSRRPSIGHRWPSWAIPGPGNSSRPAPINDWLDGKLPIFQACGDRILIDGEMLTMTEQLCLQNFQGFFFGRITRNLRHDLMIDESDDSDDGDNEDNDSYEYNLMKDERNREWSRKCLMEALKRLDWIQLQLKHGSLHGNMSTTEIRWRTIYIGQGPSGTRLRKYQSQNFPGYFGGQLFPPTTLDEESALCENFGCELGGFIGTRELLVVELVNGQEVLMLGPRIADVDDIVVVLDGGVVPFVMRPGKDQVFGEVFSLLGEWYDRVVLILLWDSANVLVVMSMVSWTGKP